MTPNTNPIQFPRQIWQTVSERARGCLVENDFCPEQSRIENLRCVQFESEKDLRYGSQVWHFEAIGVDHSNRRHMLYGVLRFSVQYGLLEIEDSQIFADVELRQAYLADKPDQRAKSVWSQPFTKFWVCSAVLAVCVSALVYASLVYELYSRAPSNPATTNGNVTLLTQSPGN